MLSYLKGKFLNDVGEDDATFEIVEVGEGYVVAASHEETRADEIMVLSYESLCDPSIARIYASLAAAKKAKADA